ncbi:MAG TPA: hypothetical protein VET26_06975 [Candidatus Sulfotelmatobacter sp.]|nr:hypothetical protein [Candidatus Sulfotelmatobacter sp.]
MSQQPERNRSAEWSTWAGAALAAVAAAAAILIPAGGQNRVVGVAAPMAVGAAALVANVLTMRSIAWIGALLYAAASLALLYGMILAVSVPVRLSVSGTCPQSTVSCPLGFERPLTSAENAAIYVAVTLGVIALVLTFIAVETRYLRKPRPLRYRDAPPR